MFRTVDRFGGGFVPDGTPFWLYAMILGSVAFAIYWVATHD